VFGESTDDALCETEIADPPTFRYSTRTSCDLAESFGSHAGQFWLKYINMKSYQVTPEVAGFSSKRMLLRGLLSGGLFGAIQVIGRFLWPSLFSDPLLTVVGSAVIFGFLFWALDTRQFNYKVLVSDDCITVVRSRYQRSVRKNEVKTVTESDGNVLLPPSMRISKYGWFGTFFWGGIWIPKALPECAAIRDLALSWKDSTTV